jgi:hypothetical protein
MKNLLLALALTLCLPALAQNQSDTTGVFPGNPVPPTDTTGTFLTNSARFGRSTSGGAAPTSPTAQSFAQDISKAQNACDKSMIQAANSPRKFLSTPSNSIAQLPLRYAELISDSPQFAKANRCISQACGQLEDLLSKASTFLQQEAAQSPTLKKSTTAGRSW